MMKNRKKEFPTWSIKVFKSTFITSEQPSSQTFTKPTLTARDVTDIPADFVADPFIISDQSTFYMFFEVLNKYTARGEIGMATSKDGDEWRYEKIVLKEDFHLSYPHVFTYNDQFYMIPETIEANGVFLYKSKRFPEEWEKVCELIPGTYFDSSIFFYQEKWWLLAGTIGKLHLFFSNQLEEGWIEHPKSPLISDNQSISRPAGRVIVDDGAIYRFTQDYQSYYGKSVTSFKITALSETEYLEEEITVVLQGSNQKGEWRKDGMHHIDQLKIKENEWLIAVDGQQFQNYRLWRIKRFLNNPVVCTRRLLGRNSNLLLTRFKKVLAGG